MEKEFVLKTGKRTYFFDLEESKIGDIYLEITESKRHKDGYSRSTITLRQDHIEGFVEQLEQVMASLRAEAQENSYSVEEIRKQYPNAYIKWDDKQDEHLTRLYCEGLKVSEIAKMMGRQPSAIRSRVKKLGLKEKYDQ